MIRSGEAPIRWIHSESDGALSVCRYVMLDPVATIGYQPIGYM